MILKDKTIFLIHSLQCSMENSILFKNDPYKFSNFQLVTIVSVWTKLRSFIYYF